MTEKRFVVTNISNNGNTGLFWLGKDNLSVYDVVRLLNDLNDENEQLKKEINSIGKEIDMWEAISELDGISIDDVKKENIELKKKNEYLNAQLDLIDAMTKMVNSAIR